MSLDEQKWHHYYAGQCCAQDCIHIDDKGNHLSLDYGQARFVTIIQNLVVQHGGLAAVIDKLYRVREAGVSVSPTLPRDGSRGAG